MKNFKKISYLLIVLVLLFAATIPAFGNSQTRVWVQFKPGGKDAVQNALTQAGAETHYTFEELNAFVVSLPSPALNGIQNNPNVVSVEEDAPRYLISEGAGNSPTSLQIGLDAVRSAVSSQVVPYGIDKVQAREVWDANHNGKVDKGAPTGKGRTVCIVDTGFYKDHEDFEGVNLVGGTSQVGTPYTTDGYGHGTHVAGTIDAANNDLGVVGVTPGAVSLYIVKVFDDNGNWTRSSDLVNAVFTCRDHGANVISMSLGGSIFNGLERLAFEQLYAQGILSIAAAGNDGNTDYSYPASYDSVVSVAATDINNNVANFSQKNAQVELAAPGVGVLSTVPYIAINNVTVDGVSYSANQIEFAPLGTATGALVDGGRCLTTGNWSGTVVLCERGDISFYEKVMNVQNSGGVAAVIYNNAPGNFLGTLGDGNSSDILAVSLSQEDGQYLVANKLGASATVVSDLVKPASGYEAWNGTSMATPHVSGVAALIWSANPSWTNAQIREALDNTAFDLGAPGRDTAYGYGLVQAKAALDYLNGK